MKKILFIAFGSIAITSVQAQEPADALRFSWQPQGATARIQAVGGAMGSLGGDITATFVNPAGLAFYKTGDFVVGSSYSTGKTKGTFLGNESKESTKRFNWGTTGLVIGGGSEKKDARSLPLSSSFSR